MPERPPTLPTTEEQRPPTEDDTPRGRPVLLAAFPKQVGVPLPPPGEAVGRTWLADAGIVDSKVSREHLRFSRRGSRLDVEDVGSRSGTKLNGIDLTPHVRTPLDDGEILRIGNTVLVYRESFAGSPTPEPPLGDLVGPWGLGGVRQGMRALATPAVLNVLIEGETGTGKELLAREIARSLGRSALFLPVNVAAIAPNLFEGHLFGWQRGGFSGSVQANVGVLRGSEGGVVFFDEIEALPLDLQPKLLRFLQSREVFPLGGLQPARVDVIVVAATNRPMSEMLEQSSSRRDLAASFNVSLRLPPLRDRAEDVFAIFEARWRSARGPLDLARVRVDADAVALMMRHRFMDNVREVERLVVAVDPAVGLKASVVRHVLGMDAQVVTQPPSRDRVARALAACGGNKSQAVRTLGISRGRLIRLLEEYGLS